MNLDPVMLHGSVSRIVAHSSLLVVNDGRKELHDRPVVTKFSASAADTQIDCSPVGAAEPKQLRRMFAGLPISQYLCDGIERDARARIR
jgi:hypothetical protein